MKKILSYILTAALLLAVLTVPVSATSPSTTFPTEGTTGNSSTSTGTTGKNLYDVYLHIHINADAASPSKIVRISEHSALGDDALTLAEVRSIVGQYYDTTNATWDGLYLDDGTRYAQLTNLTAMRQEQNVYVRIFVGIPEINTAFINATDASAAPGETFTVTLSIRDINASSVGVKYSIPEGLEFVGGQWLLSGGLLSNVTDFGAAFASANSQIIGGDFLQLTFRVLEDCSTLQYRFPFQVVVKNVDVTFCDEAPIALVTVNHPIQGIRLDSTNRSIAVGTTTVLQAQVEPPILADQVIWYSDNEYVATVENGVVTGVSAGTARITAQLGDYTSECTVRVNTADDQSNGSVCLFTGEPGCIMHLRCILHNMFH